MSRGRRSRPEVSLLLHLAGGALLALALFGICALFRLFLPVPLLLCLGLASGTVRWIIHVGADRADQLHAPELDLDLDYALPHAQDVRVRRLEDLIHGAQPNRRMTSRGLARTLGRIAEEQDRDPEVPPLSPPLAKLLETARHPDAETHPVGPIDRPALHRCLNELAQREERDR